MAAQTKAVLIPDGESHILQYVICCLSRVKYLRIHVMSSKRMSAMRYSRFIDSYHYYDDSGQDALWIENINKEVGRHDIDLIMPIFEKGIRRIIANEDLLNFPDRLCLLPNLNSFDTAIDKWRLYRHLSGQNIASPETWLYSKNHAIDKSIFPVVAKPARGFGGGMQVQLLTSAEELQEYMSTKDWKSTNYILQRYVEGTDYACSVLCRHGKILAYTIQRSLTSESHPFGPQLAYRFEPNDRLLEIAAKLMGSLSWTGIASIDFRYDRHHDSYQVLEVNTRFWRSLVGSLYAGVNFPAILLDATSERKIVRNNSYDSILFYDLKGLAKAIRKEPSVMFDLNLLRRNSPLGCIVVDPLPYLLKYLARSRNLLRKHLSKFQKKGG